MYSTCLVTDPCKTVSGWEHQSKFDLEKAAKAAARSAIAASQKLSHADLVSAEISALAIEEQLASRSARRRAEHELADYIESEVVPHFIDHKLAALPHRLRACRHSATLAVNGAGKTMTLWDYKCGQNRLCPDESRNETHRLIERFEPAFESALKQNPNYRLYSVVLTLPNFPAGKLRNGLTDIYTRFNRLRKKRVNKKLVFPEIVGAVTVVEAPLSKKDDWNVHMNVMLLVDGFLDFKKLRKHWHWNLHAEHVEGDTTSIVKSLKEIIKYAVMITPGKSKEHSDTGKSKAPAMTEWNCSLWHEWWISHNRYRRVRSYGLLFLNEKHREELDLPEPVVRSLDDDDLTIIGRVYFNGNRYSVELSELSLIREDKSISEAQILDVVERSTHPPGSSMIPPRQVICLK